MGFPIVLNIYYIYFLIIETILIGEFQEAFTHSKWKCQAIHSMEITTVSSPRVSL